MIACIYRPVVDCTRALHLLRLAPSQSCIHQLKDMANSTLLLCSLWLALALAVLGADTLYPPSYDGSWALQPPAPRAAGPYRQTTRHEIIERSFRKPFERRASSVPGVCTIPTPPGRNLAYFARAAISGSSNVAVRPTRQNDNDE